MIDYDEVIDQVMLYFSQGDFVEEVAEAKNEFHKTVGIFDEESIDLEGKINLFLDWYVFYRPLKDKGKTPVQLICENEIEIPADWSEKSKSLCESRHSLFEFIKVKGEDVHIKDLYSGYKMILKKSLFILGFSKSEIFSARLFPFEDTFIFSKAFCIHPAEACKFILKEVKKINKLKGDELEKAREELIFRLLKMRYKIEQYKHINIEDIYTNEPKLRI